MADQTSSPTTQQSPPSAESPAQPLNPVPDQAPPPPEVDQAAPPGADAPDPNAPGEFTRSGASPATVSVADTVSPLPHAAAVPTQVNSDEFKAVQQQLLTTFKSSVADLWHNVWSAQNQELLSEIFEDVTLHMGQTLVSGNSDANDRQQIEAQVYNIVGIDHVLVIQKIWASVGTYVNMAFGVFLHAASIAVKA